MRPRLWTQRALVGVVVGALSIFGLSTSVLSRQGLSANAGSDQSGVFVGNVVNLTGAGSVGATTYAWTFVSRPTGSAAVLQNAATVTPSFVPDKRGTYTVRLIAGNGTGATATDTVAITTANRPPIANAGPDLSEAVGDSVALLGSASSDPDADKLTYRWTVVSAPAASLARLSNATKVKATLMLDRPGAYVVELVVRDGTLFSTPDLVIVTTSNSAPEASAGPDRQISAGIPVQLDGAGSSDVDEDALTYSWALKRPSGSHAVLDNPVSPMPSFVPDRAGSYTATLTVNDGAATAKDTVVMATSANRPPVARAGSDDRTLLVGDSIQLDATGSTDANGQLLGYAWTLTKKPSGSTAPLSNPASPRPTFTADRKGKYTFSLVTTDAGALSGSDTRLFSAALPEAAAGPDQVVEVGATVTLDGSGSSHLEGTLAFGWALIGRPAGSAAALDDPADPQPRFVADLAGVYIAQLIVFDGARLSPADTVVVTTGANLAPIVDLGPNRLVTTGVPVLIDATATDPNDDSLTITWALLGRPAGSAASLSTLSATPVQLIPDVPGDYVVQLIATDPSGLASFDTVLMTTGNTRPSVDAGADLDVATGTPVPLEAVASDPSGGPVSYDWRILSGPGGADLNNPATDSPTFTAGQDGVYVVQVVVRDANNLTATDAVVIRATEGGSEPLTLALTPKTVSIPSGGSTVLTVTASAIVPSSLVVNLSSSNAPLLGVPQTVTIPAGQASANFDATASGGTGGAIVTASAASAGTAKATIAVGARLVEWTDDVSGNWSDATKWTGDIAPGPGDVVVIDRPAGDFVITVNAPTASVRTLYATEQLNVPSTLTINGTASIDGGLVLTSLLNGPGNIVLGGPGTWNSGTIDMGSGTFTVAAGGTLTMQTPADHGLVNTTLRNHGTVQWTGGRLLHQGGNNTVVNESDGTWNVTGANLEVAFAGQPFTNAGLLHKTGTGQLALGATVANTGTIDVDSGELLMTSAGLTNSGTIDVAGGATLNAHLMTFANGTTFAGAGTITMPGTTAVTATNLNVTLPTLLTSLLAGPGSVTISAPFTWNSGTIDMGSGTVTVAAGRTLTMQTPADHGLVNTTLRNHGTVQWTGGRLLHQGGNNTVVNESDGTWNVTGANLEVAFAGQPFTNAGLLHKTGTGQLALGATVANTGTIDVDTGELLMTSAGLTNSGTIDMAAGTTLNAHLMTFANGTTFAGTGTMALQGTTHVSATNLNLTLPAVLTSLLAGPGSVTINAPFTWNSGTIDMGSGTVTVAAGRTFTMQSAADHGLVNTTLRNHGTVQWTGGRLLHQGGNNTVINESDGTWNVTGANLEVAFAGQPFTNAGLLRKTSTGQLALGATVANTGTIDIDTGELLMSAGGLTNTGTIDVAAGATLNAHLMTFANGTTFAGTGTMTLPGTTTVTATNLNLTLPAVLTSLLAGPGSVTVNAPFTWTSGTIDMGSGTVAVAAARTLTIQSAADHGLVNTTLRNHGTVQWTGGRLLHQGGNNTVINESDGTWNVTGANLEVAFAGQPFTNAGLLHKTSSGQLALGATVTNTGTIDIDTGELLMSAGGLTNTGTIDVAGGATLNAHLMTFANGTTFAGAGTITMPGTTTVTATNLTLTLPTTLTSTLQGPGSVTVNAAFTWTSGTINMGSGTVTVVTGRTLTMQTTADHGLVNTTLRNHGTVQWTGGRLLYQGGNNTVINESDGIWNVGAGAFEVAGGAGQVFTNLGLLKGTGVATTTLTVSASVSFTAGTTADITIVH